MARRTRLIFLATILLVVCFNFSQKPSPLTSMIDSSLPPQPQWILPKPVSSEEKRIKTILSQKLTYLGEGQQALAFQTQDGKHVVKFFKMRRFEPSWADYLCPHVVRRRFRNLNWIFNGYKNAYTDLRKETGLVWIHLAKTNYLNQSITIVDKEGIQYQIDADATEFVIQEKAELIFDHFSRLYREGKLDEMESAIHRYYNFIQARMDKGYVDRDKGVTNNYGFIGDRPIQLDIGRLYKGVREEQLERIKRRVEKWRSEELSPQ